MVDCYNSGDIIMPNHPYVGGLIGYCENNSTISVTDSYNSGSISGYNAVGGLIGGINHQSAKLAMVNCYSAATSVTVASSGVAGSGIGTIAKCGSFNASNLFVRKGAAAATIGTDILSCDQNTFIQLTYAQMTDASFVTHLGTAFAKFSTDIYNGGEYSADDWATYTEYYGDYHYPILVSTCGASPLGERCNVQFLGAQYAKVTVNGSETYATTVTPGSQVNFTIETGDPEITVTSVAVGDSPLEATDGTYSCTVSADTFVTITLSGTMTAPGDGGDDTPEKTGYPISFTVSDGTNPIEDAQITVTGAEDASFTPEEGIFWLDEGSYTVSAVKEGYHSVTGTLAVNSDMSKEETNTLSFNLYPTSVSSRTITMNIVAANTLDTMMVYNGDLMLEQKEAADSVSFTFPAGSYIYSATKADSGYGSGPFTIADQDGAQTLTLRAMDMTTYGLSNSSNVGYTVTMKAADGTEYFPGSLDAKNGGGARGWFLLPASDYGEEYHYTFNPVSDYYWGSYGVTYLYSGYVGTALRDFNGISGSQSDTGKFVIAPKETATFTVPTGATLRICHRVKFYEPLEVLTPTNSNESGGMTTYTYDIPTGITLHYELEMPGYVKKAATFTGAVNKTITTANLTPASAGAKDIEATIDSAVLTNAPSSHYIELNAGERFDLYLHRNWQASNSITGNYYVDPTYHIEVISGSSVTVTDNYYAGATLNAVSNGVSIIRITYDALDFVNSSDESYIYSKLYEENTTVLVVNVGGNGIGTIDSGCGASEFEIQYFIRSINDTVKAAEDQYAELTFTPSANVVSVELHAPVGSTGAWTDSWTSLKKSGNSFTAHLKEGSNVLRFKTADGTTSYHVIRAIGLDMTATGDTLQVKLEKGQFLLEANTNNDLTFRFQGLQMPLPKLAALINPGLESVMNGGKLDLVESTYATYTLRGSDAEVAPTTIQGKSSQYEISTKNAVTVNFATPDTYTLTEGALHTTSFGAGSYTGMTKGGYTGTQPSYRGGSNTSLDTRKNLYSAMPDLTIVVTELVKSSDATVETVKVSGVAATGEGNTLQVVLPYGSTISGETSEISVKATHSLAQVSTPATTDGGKTWTFTVTAQDGTVQTYTVHVSVSTVYAKVTFHLNGGTCADLTKDVTTVSYTADKAGKALPTPTKEGYRFDGWYDTASKAEGTKYTTVSADLPAKLYALWSVDEDYGKITVTFTLYGSTKSSKPIDLKENPGELYGAKQVTWVPTTTYKLDSGSRVYDVFVKAMADYKLSYTGAEDNYVRTINGMSEFTNGAYSGWKYSVNGYCPPDKGLKEYTLSSGDVVVWYYVNDYRFDGDEYDESDSDEVKANQVEKLIDQIGTVTLNSADKIKAARSAYDKLSTDQKKLVENYKKLTAAEDTLSNLQVQNVITLINQIGKVSLNSIGRIQAAQSALDGLSAAQKAKVTNSRVLAEAWASYNRLRAEAVEKLIDDIPASITAESKDAIEAARKAYDALSNTQKSLVDKEHLDKLKKAEASLASLTATDEDKEKAQKVIQQIQNLGTTTLNSEKDIEAARKAYDALTDLQKTLVTNYDDLVAAEKTLAGLKATAAFESIYITTGDYLESLGTPTFGSIGGEWMAIGLARSDRKIPNAEDYYNSVVKYVQENIDGNGRLHSVKSTDNSRLILALTAMGKDVTKVGSHNLLLGLSDLDYIKTQGINGPIWALLALDSGNYPAPDGTVSRVALIQAILDAQLDDGGWALSGSDADVDMTGMALQALAPYREKLETVGFAIDDGLTCLANLQNADGSFSSVDGASCESIAQVVVALTALGIDPAKDERFIKNDVSALDALLEYYVTGGGFKHLLSGNRDGMATEQAYYALTSYYRFLKEKTSLYDMTDVIDMGGDPDIVSTEPTTVPTEPDETEEESGFPWFVMIVVLLVGIGIGGCAVVILPKMKKHGKYM